MCCAVAAESATPDDGLLPAVYRCDVGEAMVLLDAGANPNHVVRIFLGERPILLSALENDCSGIVQLLLQRGADVNGASTGLFSSNTPLLIAAKKGNLELVKLLLQYKPNIEHDGGMFHGETALIVALENRHTEVADLLVKNGANVNPRDSFDRTALMSSAMHGETEVVRALLSYGADANLKDHFDATALMFAAQNGFLEISRLLLDNKADVNARSLEFNSMSAHWAAGQTALMIAAQQDRVEIVDLLLKRGANRMLKNADSKNAFDLASSERVKALLRR
jgi:ankyrin repeat protein